MRCPGCFLVDDEREWFLIKLDANKHQVTETLVSHIAVFMSYSRAARNAFFFLLLLLLFNCLVITTII